MATCSFIKESKQTVGAMGRVLRYVSQEKKTVDYAYLNLTTED